MSDTNREEFEKKFPPPIGTTYNVYHDQYDTCDEHGELCNQSYTSDYRIWQAATSASDARYQARVRELEEALQKIKSGQSLIGQFGSVYAIATKALSATTPDAALQRDRLKTRLDEMRHFGISGSREAELRAQLAALNRNETLGE